MIRPSSLRVYSLALPITSPFLLVTLQRETSRARDVCERSDRGSSSCRCTAAPHAYLLRGRKDRDERARERRSIKQLIRLTTRDGGREKEISLWIHCSLCSRGDRYCKPGFPHPHSHSHASVAITRTCTRKGEKERKTSDRVREERRTKPA